MRLFMRSAGRLGVSEPSGKLLKMATATGFGAAGECRRAAIGRSPEPPNTRQAGPLLACGSMDLEVKGLRPSPKYPAPSCLSI
jgi:hypothetical protein